MNFGFGSKTQQGTKDEAAKEQPKQGRAKKSPTASGNQSPGHKAHDLVVIDEVNGQKTFLEEVNREISALLSPRAVPKPLQKLRNEAYL